MPSINNYSFSNVTYIVPEGSNVSGLYPTAVITLTPEPGYTLNANDFSLDTSSYFPELQSVSFAQSGLNVICTAVFATNFVMPSTNVPIPLCVIGGGKVEKREVSGRVYNIIGANVEGDIDPVENHFYTYYSETGALDETKIVFTKTFTAPTGYYLSAEIFMTQGNAGNYTIERLPTYDIDGNLIAITWNAHYLFPNYDVTGDEWTLKVAGSEIYVAPQFVTSYTIDTINVNPVGEVRDMFIYGDEGAVFSIVMTDSSSNVYNIVTNGIIGSTGIYTATITFPDITLGTINEVYEIVLSGDIDPNMALPTTIELIQNLEQPIISLTASSSYGITGFTTVSAQGNAFEAPSNLFINANWTLTSANEDISYSGFTDITDFKFTQPTAADTEVATSVVNSNTVTLINATGVQIGDRFNVTGQPLAPFSHEVINVSGNTLTVSPPVTVAAGIDIFTYRTNGNVINNPVVVATQIDPTTINLDVTVQVQNFGDEDVTFTLNLDEIIEVDIVPITCGSTVNSGGDGITDLVIPLEPTGGLLTFLLNGQGIADKFEIIHGGPSGTKVATSSMTPGGNNGPFDNVYGTEPSNVVPTEPQVASIPQFIGTNKGPIPSGQIEFTDNIGYTINNMTIGGIDYQQIIWWAYDAADYATSPIAILRITGTVGTGWDVLRICCPDSNCIPA
jgi:hypothetical protein